MAEIMAVHDGLAEEYIHIFVAYMRTDGCYLEFPALQRGLIWGVGRLAEVRPDLLRKSEAPALLIRYLDSEDSEVRGLTARALGILRVEEAKERLADLKNDAAGVLLYNKGELETATVRNLAAEPWHFIACRRPLHRRCQEGRRHRQDQAWRNQGQMREVPRQYPRLEVNPLPRCGGAGEPTLETRRPAKGAPKKLPGGVRCRERRGAQNRFTVYFPVVGIDDESDR